MDDGLGAPTSSQSTPPLDRRSAVLPVPFRVLTLPFLREAMKLPVIHFYDWGTVECFHGKWMMVFDSPEAQSFLEFIETFE